MENNCKTSAWQLAVLMSQSGVRHVVVSPGSRNTPVILALARYGRFTLHYIVDERVAAFAALGMSVTLDEPVAAVCTSGSAVLNYAPAVAEAYYSNIPLIVVSADRPFCDIDQNQPQTIRQAGILHHIVRKSVDIRDGEDPVYSNRLINEALNAALNGGKGPVHINLQYRPPLNAIGSPDGVPAYKINNFAATSTRPNVAIEPHARYLIVIGGLKPDESIKTMLEAIVDLPINMVVIAEAQSNLSGISTITEADFETCLSDIPSPDYIFIIGSPLVSAKMNSYISSQSCQKLYVGIDSKAYTFDSINIDPALFLSSLKKSGKTVDYRSEVAAYRRISKPSAVAELISHLSGKDINLHLSNGTTIREAQKTTIARPTSVWANRGVSGIDGCSSTAIGAALVSKRPVILVTGDMSAAYDIGALAVKGIDSAFTMIVVNNGGGEIFRRVDTTRNLPERETYFTAMPKFPLRLLAEAYGFDYQQTTNPDEIYPASGNKPQIIEFITPNTDTSCVPGLQ